MLLTLLVTHLSAEVTERQLRYMAAVAPATPIVVCHNGDREQFEALRHDDKLFLDDDSFRTDTAWGQSETKLLRLVHERYLTTDAYEAVFVLEYDQLILRGDFAVALHQLLKLTGADMLGKTCRRRDGGNWVHAVRARRDPAFMAFLRELSVREDPSAIFGCLGSGFVIRRDALAALVAVPAPALDYHEMYMPTVLHHLGYAVADIDEVSELYDEVEYLPVRSVEDVIAAKRRGHFFTHPFKRLDRLDEILAAPGYSR